MDKKIKTAALDDMLNLEQNEKTSDLVKAMEFLRNNDNIESNTVLENEQVNALSLMNWAAQVYDIEFFKHYVSTFPKYRISGDKGLGRKQLIQIAEAIQRNEALKEERMFDFMQRR